MHRQAIALVAAQLARAAERRDAAVRALEHVLEGRRLVGHGLAVAVHHPARRQRLVVELVDLDLARRDGGGGHVELERRVASSRAPRRRAGWCP